ncbi:MAG: ribonuclease E/G [Alphaproteobacteria bacterium]
MARRLVISASPGEQRAAIVDAEGRVQRFFLERAQRPSRVGNIYVGRVRSAVAGLAGLFVDVGDAEIFVSAADVPPPAILSGARAAKPNQRNAMPIAEGALIVVQIAADAVGDKRARGTGIIGLPLRALTFRPWTGGVAVARGAAPARAEALRKALTPTLKKGEGVVVRAHAVSAPLEHLRREIDAARITWQTLSAAATRSMAPGLIHADLPFAPRLAREVGGELDIDVDDADLERQVRTALPDARVTVHPDSLFETLGLEDEWQGLLERRVALPKGASLTVDMAEAATLIDVDATGGAGEGTVAHRLAVNLDAAAAIARQLRLRDIGGQVLVDFLRLERDADRQRVLKALIASANDDERPVKILGFTRLGLVELTRKREGPSIVELLARPGQPTSLAKSFETIGHELLRGVLAADRAQPGRVRAVAVSADLGGALDGAALAIARSIVERRLGRALELRITAGRVSEAWLVVL